jgi:hypothetical protein
MHFYWNTPKPSPQVQAELNKFGSYELSMSQFGTTHIVTVKCRGCTKKLGPMWVTVRALKRIGRDGQCWTCH